MSKLNGIKAISFDMDNTLWDFQMVLARSLEQALLELHHIDPEVAALLSVEKLQEVRDNVADRLKPLGITLEKIRHESFRQALRDVGRPNDATASRMNDVFFEHRFGSAAIYDDVLPTLDTLRRKYSLGLLTNGNSDPKRCGLAGMFQFVVMALDHGIEKPDPRIFQIAMEQAECSAHEFIHVGDSLEDDVKGAANAGIKSVWVNRNGEASESNIEIAYEVSSLHELLEIL